MINTSENPASIRSKMYLVEALLKLMDEKSYDTISIKELTDRAKLSRRTFYTNFETKEDILKYHFDTLVNEYIEILQTYECLTPNDIANEYFSYWFSHKNLLLLLKKNNLPILIKVFEEFLRNMNSLPIIKNRRFTDSELQYYDAVFVAGGLWNMLNVWIENDFGKSPEEMTAIFTKIFTVIPSDRSSES
ncbi:TetR/AcrR family transcriptional regulator [Clostridium paridis]|uniref:TetR/AcrR family transcriptional regulator n=1 Tax=Clostridium paridis TaxID=2803863 RepID=A0A937FGL6_9CLOT|nr:TetR/AcrR family transcriptional regulator [Clostridium paridis]MBL4931582.1 TetR/AcrR family transcriptional regulator [Clostridium paridis]